VTTRWTSATMSARVLIVVVSIAAVITAVALVSTNVRSSPARSRPAADPTTSTGVTTTTTSPLLPATLACLNEAPTYKAEPSLVGLSVDSARAAASRMGTPFGSSAKTGSAPSPTS
jgi:tetrahydromethanopterin S-methyltransferase subunit D